MSDVIRQLILWHRYLNKEITWREVVSYGGLAALAYTVYCFAVKPFLSPLRKIPGPGYNPLFGNVREAMVGEAMASSIKWVKKYGGIVRFYHLFGRERVLVADPDGLRHMMVTHVYKYRRIPTFGQLLGESIFGVSGEEHTFQKRLMNPFFNHNSIESYLHVFQTNCNLLMKHWHKQIGDTVESTVICVQDSLMCMALDSIGQAVFSYDFNALGNSSSPAFQAFRTVTNLQSISFLQLLPFADKLPTQANRERDESIKVIDDIIYDIINKKRVQIMKGQDALGQLVDYCDAARDLLGKLMVAKDEETGKRFTDKQLRDQVLGLLVAGHETTGVTMSWLLLLLANNQDIQDKAREEVLEVLPPADQPIEWQHLDQLTYLTAVIKETQRLYPAAPSVYRRLQEDDVMQGYFLPKGTLVAYHVGALMRNPKIWEDPDKFDPERFLGDRGAKVETYTHLPFMTGPYKCLGHQFAKVQIKTVIANLLRNFKFTKPDDLSFKRKMRITLKAVPPVSLNVMKI